MWTSVHEGSSPSADTTLREQSARPTSSATRCSGPSICRRPEWRPSCGARGGCGRDRAVCGGDVRGTHDARGVRPRPALAASGRGRAALPGHLLDAVGEAVIATDLDGVVRHVNPAAERLCGWAVRQVRGTAIVELNVLEHSSVQAHSIMAQGPSPAELVRQVRGAPIRRHDLPCPGDDLPLL
ncbi:PAS domain-containing protein [Egibacter rhizosphaerae]|uniref:PAS domain-containing protein n=1 Tax=Egibacter rhizosphaerae TaxID=1670831 RepID=A0A411YLU5_9ACTN|nr:PAS domain-containing protein [Egibacter rhizosphaerae]